MLLDAEPDPLIPDSDTDESLDAFSREDWVRPNTRALLRLQAWWNAPGYRASRRLEWQTSMEHVRANTGGHISGV